MARFRPVIDGLEYRVLLTSMIWDLTTGGDWDSAINWVNQSNSSDHHVPTPSDTATINLSSAGTVTHNNAVSNAVGSLTTNSSTSLSINAGSLTIGTGSGTTSFGGPVSVGAGSLSIDSGTCTFSGKVQVVQNATLNVGGAGTTLKINAVTITDNGSMTIPAGTTVNFGVGFETPAQILVNGTLTIGDTTGGATLTGSGQGAARTFTLIQVNSGGELKAQNSTFSIDRLTLESGSVLKSGDLSGNTFNQGIEVPIEDVANLAGNKVFQDVYITGSLPSPSPSNVTSAELTNSIATDSSKLQYVFPDAFEINSGCTLKVDGSVKVLLDDNQSLAVDTGGALTIGAATVVQEESNKLATEGIVVNGKMTTTGTQFQIAGGGDTARIEVKPGGRLIATGTTFAWDNVILDSGYVLNPSDLSGDTFNKAITLPIEDVANLAPKVAGSYVAVNSFEDIDVTGSLPSSSGVSSAELTNSIATDPTRVTYVFPAFFEIKKGGTLKVDDGVNVLLDAENKSLTVDLGGTLTIGDANGGATVVQQQFASATGPTTEGIVVSGNMNVANSSFTIAKSIVPPPFADVAIIQVNSGGELQAQNSTFSWDSLTLDSGSVLKPSDLSGDTFNQTITVPWQDVQFLGDNQSFEEIEILGDTMASGASLSLDPIGTVSTANLVYRFAGNFTVGAGATVSVGDGVRVLFPYAFTVGPGTSTAPAVMTVRAGANLTFSANLTVNTGGTMTFADGSSLQLEHVADATTQILVTGTLDLGDTTGGVTVSSNPSAYQSSTSIDVKSGGQLNAQNSTFSIDKLIFDNGSLIPDLANNAFSLPVHAPWQDIASFGNNLSFEDIYINDGTVPGGQTLSLGPIGKSTALVYIFSGNFTVDLGATLTVAPGTAVLIDHVTITDYGAMTIAGGASVGFVEAALSTRRPLHYHEPR